MIRTLKIASILLLAIVQSCLLKPEIDKETYYIPDGFTGKVLVLFNCKDGNPKEWTDDGRRLYRIPASGVLKTQFKPNTGSRYEYEDPKKQIKSLRDYYKFFYVDDNGGMSPLNYGFCFIDGFKKEFKSNTINVTGFGGIFGFGAHELYYKATINYIFKGIDKNYTGDLSFTGSSIDKNDWHRIRNWSTFDMRQDSIPISTINQ